MMVRQKIPDITTMAIGDGANDVNMITAAHVGVGISGQEGQQAARASDYAIGQFKYLKTLMFIHGREAYRRNAYLISYMFYKNTLFVIPIFWFGFVSVYSGTTFYDSSLYQLYNITFTTLPVMYFALYDFEFEKDVFLKDYKLYKIGLKGNYLIHNNSLVDECFSKWIFWRWIFYAIWQGALALFVSFYSMEDVDPETGRASTLMADGQFVYFGVVTLVNLKVLLSTNNFNFWIFFFVFGSILDFVLSFWFLNLWQFTDIYMLFNYVFHHPLCYFALFFIGISLILVDNGLNLAHYEIKVFLDLQEQARQRKLMYLISQDRGITRRRVTTLKRKTHSHNLPFF